MPPKALFTDFDNPPPPQPYHPKLVGKATVLSSASHSRKDLAGPSYKVDLSTRTCSCDRGQPWEWHNNQQKWTEYMACSHKIRAMADIVVKEEYEQGVLWAYIKAVAARYNMYEVVSAFHKELRNNEPEKAIYWGSMLMTFRGQKGVYKYLLNILYEECRDHTLGDVILDRCINSEKQSYADICKLIKLFCECKKKWELPHRYKFLEGEMQGYTKLVRDFGRDVAKGSNIVPFRHRTKLYKCLMEGLAARDLPLFQYGLKGLQKSKCVDIDKFRAEIANKIIDASGNNPPPGLDELEAYIGRRASHGFGVGYHELNALADLLTGEPYADGNTPPDRIAAVLAAPPPRLRLGVVPVIPTYAHDNHTYAGKAAIKKYPHEFLPNATQDHMDLRLCGAYMGVTWRHLAFKQYGTIDVKWGSVEWPVWLAGTVQNLWYTLFVGLISWHGITAAVGQLFL